MSHFYRVSENMKNKEYATFLFDKQMLVVMQHLRNIKMEIGYIICVS
jgi:hypothetical protein